jgi:hypothetical protein
MYACFFFRKDKPLSGRKLKFGRFTERLLKPKGITNPENTALGIGNGDGILF